MQVQSLSWEDPLGQEMATCYSVAWESHGQRSLVATIHAESNVTEQLSTRMHAHAHAHTHTHTHIHTHIYSMGFPGSSARKESACSAGDPGSVPGSRRSPGEGIGYPL